MSTTDNPAAGEQSEADDPLFALLDRLNVPVCLMGLDGTIKHISPTMSDALGWSQDEVVGREVVSVAIAATETAMAVSAFQQVLSGQHWFGSFPIKRKDGTRIMSWWMTTTVSGPDGRPQGVVCMLVGDQDQGRAEPREVDVAEEANLLLDTVLANVPVPLAIVDRKLRFVRANDALAAVNHMPAWAHVGVSLHSLFDRLPGDVAADVEAVFQTGEAIVGKEVAAGERTWVMSYYPVRLRGEVRWVGAVIVEETERMRLLALEQQARTAAEAAADRLSRLQSVTALLSGARTVSDVCTVVVQQGMAGVDAANGVLCLLTDDGTELEIAHALGVHPDTTENWGRFPADAPVPAVDAMRTGQPVFFTSIEDRDRKYPLFAGQPALNQAYATLPLSVTGRSFGAVTFGWAAPRTFSDEDRAFLGALAEQCAQALDRCRLYDAEARERSRREFLAEVSAVLASSLDADTTIERLARLVVPELADACVVHTRTADGLQLMALAHRDPEHERLLRELGADSDEIARHMRLLEVATARRPLVVSDIDPSVWDAVGRDDRERSRLRRLGLTAGLAVPLVPAGSSECVGVLSLAMSTSGRTYGADDVALAERLASRAAVAIQNARSHRALQDIAQTLQRSLLPSARPVIPGLDVAAVYRPVSDSEVGGDFYDVFPVGERRWGVVIGDVCGKGVLAASLTALARYTVRAAAVGADSPSAVLQRLNQAVLDEGVDERFCTIALAFVEPADGRAAVTMACGGHPPPLLVDHAGHLRSAGRPGTAIGMLPEADLVDTVHVLDPGDALVFYTDGVLEARAPDGTFRPTLLEEAVAAAAGSDAAGLAEAVERAVLQFEGGAARDDMAVLVVRVPS